MSAQNKFGRNTKEFIQFMNAREKKWALDELFFEAWKLGFEPSAVSSSKYNIRRLASLCEWKARNNTLKSVCLRLKPLLN